MGLLSKSSGFQMRKFRIINLVQFLRIIDLQARKTVSFTVLAHFARYRRSKECHYFCLTTHLTAQILSNLRLAFGILGEIPDVADGREINTCSWETEFVTVLHKSIEEAVCSSVGCLASVTHSTGGGGDGNEEIEGCRGKGKRMVEVPGSAYFGANYGLPLCETHFFKENVLSRPLSKFWKSREEDTYMEDHG